MDNVSYVQGSAQALVIIHCPHVSTTSPRRGGGCLEGSIGMPVLHPVPCPPQILCGHRGAWTPCI